VRGHGSGVATARLDGRAIERAELPGDLTGAHVLELELDGRWPAGTIDQVAHRFAPATPQLTPRLTSGEALLGRGPLVWKPVPGAVRYVVHRNGRPFATVRAPRLENVGGAERGIAEYQVLAVDSAGVESFLSAPVRVGPASAEQAIEPDAALLEQETPGFAGRGYVRLTRTTHTTVRVPVQVTEAGPTPSTCATPTATAREHRGQGRGAHAAGGRGGGGRARDAAARIGTVERLGVEQPGARDAGAGHAHTHPGLHGARREHEPARETPALVDHVRVTRLAADGVPVRKVP
jgi:hypothetical protein